MITFPTCALVKALTVFSSIVSFTFAGEVRGIVVSPENEPVPQAIVRLQSGDYDTTDANGQFTLSSPETSTHSPLTKELKRSQFVHQGGTLILNSPRISSARIQAYSINGRIINDQTVQLKNGINQIAPLVTVPGVYIYRVMYEGKTYTHKFVSTGETSLQHFSSGNSLLKPAQQNSRNAFDDTLYVTKFGFERKVSPISYAAGEQKVVLTPVQLTNGVTPGEYQIFSGVDTLGTVYVNPNGVVLDSATIPMKLHCISSSHTHLKTVVGPFDIPENGVVQVGDSLTFSFTENSVRGTYQSSERLYMRTQYECNWTEKYYVNGNLVIQMMKHNNHTFEHEYPTSFSSSFYSITPVVENGRISFFPNRRYFREGEVVRATAHADSGYYVAGWKNPVHDSATVKFTITDNTTIEADIRENYKLDIAVENGDFTLNPQAGSFAPNDTVRIIAKGKVQGIELTKPWEGDILNSSGDTAWVIMDSDKIISCGYPNVFTFDVTVDNGDFSILNGKEYYTDETTDTLKILIDPDYGYVFDSWTGDVLSRNSDTVWVTMDTTKALHLICVPAPKLTIIDSNCTVYETSSRSFYNKNDTVMLTVHTNSDYYVNENCFAGDILRASNDTAWVVMDSSKTVTVTGKQKVKLTIESVNGTFRNSESSNYFLPGDTAKISGWAATGYFVDSTCWSENVFKIVEDTGWVVMEGSTTVTVTCKEAYSLTVTIDDGHITKSPNKTYYSPKDTVKIDATPRYGDAIAAWNGDILRYSGESAWVHMNGNKTVSVTTGPAYKLTVGSNSTASITNTSMKTSFSILETDTVMLIGTPKEHHVNGTWSGDTWKVSGDTAWVIIDGNKSVSFSATPMPSITITEYYGREEADPIVNYYPLGLTSPVELIATPSRPNFAFDRWSGDTFKTNGDTAWVYTNYNKKVSIYYKTTSIIQTYKCDAAPNVVRFTQNDTRVFAQTQKVKHEFDKETGALIGNDPEPFGITTATQAFTPDGSRKVVEVQGDIRVTDRTGTLTTIQSIPLTSTGVHAVAISNDGSIIAAHENDSTIRVWSVASGELLYSVSGIAVSTKPVLAISGDNQSIIVIKSDSRLEKYSISGGSEPEIAFGVIHVNCAAFSLDRSRVVVGSWNRGIAAYDIATGNRIGDNYNPFDGPTYDIDMTNDGTEILIAGGSSSCALIRLPE